MYVATIQEILNNDSQYSGREKEAALEAFRKEVWNAAMDKAAEEVEVDQPDWDTCQVDRESILKLKI